MTDQKREIVWMGNSLKYWKTCPENVQDQGGYQLYRVQMDQKPTNWKPMSQIGSGVAEIRIWDKSKRTFRIIYTARYDNRIYILHAFEKKTQATPKKEIDIAKIRYRELERMKP